MTKGDIPLHFVFPVLDPSPPTLYVTLQLKSQMRYINKIQWIHWKIFVTLKKCTIFGAMRILEWSNKHSQIVIVDCSLFLIG